MDEEKQKNKQPLPMWAAACIGILVTAVLVFGTLLIVDHIQKSKAEAPTQTPTEAPTQAPTVPIESKDYTGTTETLIGNREQIIATVGNKQLTNAKLQVYYWMGIYDFINAFIEQYGFSPIYIGFDYTKDLATQACAYDPKMSWQEYFLKNAVDMWQWYANLNIAAEEANFKLSKEDQATFDNIRKTLEEDAKKNEFKDGQEMVEHDMGVGATFDAYVEYYKETYIANLYSNKLWDSVKVTEDDLNKYYEENKATFDTEGITKEDVMASVRHILLQPEGTADAYGKITATEEAWDACYTEAQKLLNSFIKSKGKEADFGELAKQHTKDGGSKETGGLYEGFTKGQMVESFDAWSFDASRKYGDTGIVKSDFGYHIMYFVKHESIWRTYADSQLRLEACNEVLNGIIEKNPLAVDYDKALLAHVNLGE